MGGDGQGRPDFRHLLGTARGEGVQREASLELAEGVLGLSTPYFVVMPSSLSGWEALVDGAVS